MQLPKVWSSREACLVSKASILLAASLEDHHDTKSYLFFCCSSKILLCPMIQDVFKFRFNLLISLPGINSRVLQICIFKFNTEISSSNWQIRTFPDEGVLTKIQGYINQEKPNTTTSLTLIVLSQRG